MENCLPGNRVVPETDKAPSKQESQYDEAATEVNNALNDDAVAISDVALTVAIDCSGSTFGKVLEEEKLAISSISGLLSPEAQARAVLLPWNDEAETPLSLDEMEELLSSGGTDPTTLIRDRHHRQALSNASLWILITDGEIDEPLVREFAVGIADAGLHGTASIVICVGRTTELPSRCNISVGKSVFAVVPDCIFLFHDVRTSMVYVLGCKGRFHALLPNPKESPVIDDSSKWEDVPQILYEALRSFRVPKRRKLLPNTVLLTSGKTFDLGDVYNDTLDPSLTSEILSNDDDLKTLLLTASTRGRKEEVKTWVSKKKLRVSDPMWVPRPDIEQRASHCLGRLVQALRDTVTTGIPSLRADLGAAHNANWKKFSMALSVEESHARTRDVIIADATARLHLIESSPASPSVMAPVSPGSSVSVYRYNPPPLPTYQPPQTYNPPYVYPQTTSTGNIQPNPYPHQYPQMQSTMYRQPYLHNHSTYSGSHPNMYTQAQYMVNQPYYPPSNGQVQPQRGDLSPPLPGPAVLFSQGYKFNEESRSSDTSFDGYCTLCTRPTQVMALILKKPEEKKPTANYPEPQQYVKHRFPFVLGNFPDVDILASELYCETCSVYLLRYGKTPKTDCVIGALPLVQTYGEKYSVNLNSWLKTLRKSFDGRFHNDITLSVFLSVLYNTLDDLTTIDSSENTYLIRAIRWACRNILQSLMVHRDSNTVPLGESPRTDPASLSLTLGETIPRLIKQAINGNGPLLNYPLDGFLVLILAARDIDNENCERESLRCVVWLRTIFHLADNHYSYVRKDGLENARDRLQHTIYSRNLKPHAGGSNFDPALVKRSITMASLEGTHLLSSDDLNTFGRMGSLFTHIGSKCGAAIAVYLHYLLEYAPMCSDAMACFDTMRREKALRKVFVAPEVVNDKQVTDLIAQLHNTKNG
jgi:hypothetical protein